MTAKIHTLQTAAVTDRELAVRMLEKNVATCPRGTCAGRGVPGSVRLAASMRPGPTATPRRC